MQLPAARSLALSLIEKNIPGWHFRFDKSTIRFGCCFYSTKTIAVSRQLTIFNTESEVRDTILHEIAHALAGHANGHNQVWKCICIGIGAKPSRCYDAKLVDNVSAPFKATCCGREYRIKKQGKWFCRICHNQLTLIFNEQYALDQIQLIAARGVK